MGQPLARYFHRNAILKAASRVFAERGTADVAVEELLKAANVSRRTFYQYFDTKDDLVEALYDVSCEILVESIREAAQRDTDPARRLETIVDVYLSFNQNKTTGSLFRVMEAEALRSERLAPRRLAIIDKVGLEIARHLDDAGEQTDPYVVHAVVSALESISLRVHVEGATPATLARAKRAMLRVLTATLAGGGVRPVPLPRPTR